jgi:uncharacterized membrane-anchored protein
VRRVPAVTFHFWAVKILSTAMGEALSDYLVHTISPFEAVGLGFIGFVIALAWQYAMRRYFAPAYWLAVVMVAVFGTMVADALHIEVGIPYATSAFDCAVALAAIFAIWYIVERTLSIHSINTPRREAFYWATVLATFAMGTALGDLSSYTWHLGWFVSGLLYTALYAIPLVAQQLAGRVLVGVHHDQAAWRVVRGLARRAPEPQRPELRPRPGRDRPDARDHRLGRVPHGLARRRRIRLAGHGSSFRVRILTVKRPGRAHPKRPGPGRR